jgi:hypothetical protein
MENLRDMLITIGNFMGTTTKFNMFGKKHQTPSMHVGSSH